MALVRLKGKLPSRSSAGLALLSAFLLVLAFPDFEFWPLAFLAFIPLLFAIENERESFVRGFIVGWLFGTTFFFGTCWWLTHAPVTYGGVPAPLAYLLLLGVCVVAGLFPAIFSGIVSLLLNRFSPWAFLSVPFVWAATEFARFWITGNNWNALAYSQAFASITQYASFGGIYLVGAMVLFLQSLGVSFVTSWLRNPEVKKSVAAIGFQLTFLGFPFLAVLTHLFFVKNIDSSQAFYPTSDSAVVNVIQPNVPMSGMDDQQWLKLLGRHVVLSDEAEKSVGGLIGEYADKETSDYGGKEKAFIEKLAGERFSASPKVIIFPESPMNFMFSLDEDNQKFLREFAVKNKASLLFNSAEPDEGGKGLYNSAVMLNEKGEKVAQYDKIHLVPFGEYVPLPEPLSQLVPTMVGNFSLGKEYDLLPFGDAKGGVMICFESHFPTLSREYVRQGADILVEMTNDGYLGNTGVLRQHLANAVFRAVETGRPVLRVTNVGITAYIDENGKVNDPTKPYTEDTRVWTVKKSSGKRTFYVKYGDWFAWASAGISLFLIVFCLLKKKALSTN